MCVCVCVCACVWGHMSNKHGSVLGRRKESTETVKINLFFSQGRECRRKNVRIREAGGVICLRWERQKDGRRNTGRAGVHVRRRRQAATEGESLRREALMAADSFCSYMDIYHLSEHTQHTAACTTYITWERDNMLSQLSVFISESEHVRFACVAASAQPRQQLWMPTSRLLCVMCGTFQLGAQISAGEKKKTQKTRRIQATAQSFRYSTRETYVDPFLLCVVLVKKKQKKNSRFSPCVFCYSCIFAL